MKSEKKGMGNNYLFFILILLFSSALYVEHWQSGYTWSGDAATYIMQAISIIKGTVHEFIASNSFTVRESSILTGPVNYPWGYPLLLAPVYFFWGMNIYAFKAVGLFCFIGFLLTLWFGFKALLKPFELLIFISLFAFNPYLLKHGNDILADIPFLFFSTVSITLLLFRPKNTNLSRDLILFSALGISMAASVLTRSNGLLVIVIFIFLITLNRFINKNFFYLDNYISRIYSIYSRKHILYLIATSLMFLAIMLLATHIIFPSETVSTYIQVLIKTFNIKGFIHNIFYYSVLIEDFFHIGNKFKIISYPLYLISILLVIFGVKDSWKITFPAILYCFITLVLCVFWPETQGLRFLFPVLPFYVFYMIIGFRSILSFFHTLKFLKYSLPLLLVGLFILVSTYFASRNIIYNRYLTYGPSIISSQEMFNYIRNNTHPDDIIVFWSPRIMRLFTNREALLLAKASDFIFFDIIVISKFLNNYSPLSSKEEFDEVLKNFTINKVYMNSDFIVYRRISK